MIDAVPLSSSQRLTLLITACALIAGAIYALRLDRIAGLIVDDAWYVLLARSLAEGTGYGLVNSPAAAMVLPPNPPGFAAVLSLVFLLKPSFPENVLWLKMAGVASMFGVGVLTYRYAVARAMPKTSAVLLAMAVVVTPSFVFLATSTVMSETIFTLTQLGGIVVLERSARSENGARAATIAGALAAAAVLIRTAGLPVPVGGAIYLLWCRRSRQAAIFMAAVACCVGPWLLYARAHAPTQAEREAHGGAHAFTYGQEFWMRWAGMPTAGTITWRDLPARVKDGLVDVFGRDVAGIVVPALFRPALESGEEVIAVGGGIFPASMGVARGTMAVSFALSAILVIGFVALIRRDGITSAEIVVPLSLVLIVTWPQWAFRFVLPMTPFLYVYLVAGLRALTPSRAVARVLLASVITLNVIEHASYIVQSRSRPLDWASDAQEVDEVFAWMQQHLTGPGHVATTNPALVYLRTGRRTVALDNAASNWTRWKQSGIRYLVCLRPADLPDPSRGYTVLYRTSRHGLWILEI